MRACESGAQVLSGKTQMQHGAGHRKTVKDRRPCDFHICFAADAPQDSVLFFAAAYISTGYHCIEGKMFHCYAYTKLRVQVPTHTVGTCVLFIIVPILYLLNTGLQIVTDLVNPESLHIPPKFK